jgi:hypothetical protein
VLVPKKTGGLRVCCDWRAITINNKLVDYEVFPLPQINDCLEQLADARWLSVRRLVLKYYFHSKKLF